MNDFIFVNNVELYNELFIVYFNRMLTNNIYFLRYELREEFFFEISLGSINVIFCFYFGGVVVVYEYIMFFIVFM